MKLWKCVKPNEVINVGELYRRYFGKSGSPYDYQMFFNVLVCNCARLTIISCTSSEPYRVTRKATFFEKVLDKFQQSWYNTITNKKGIDKHDQLFYYCF